NDSSSLIKLNYCFESGDLTLEYNGVDIFNDYADNSGSIGRILSLNKELTIDNEIDKLRSVLNQGLINEESFQDFKKSISPFFFLFESGEYEIYTINLNLSEFNVVEPNENWYPFKTDSILLTQHKESLSQITIKKYIKSLDKQNKPLIMGVQYSYTSGNLLEETPIIILDGHHKMMAYIEKKINPRFLIFNKQMEL
ncbi:hypothetical protein, partial [Psychroserpens algicola]